VDDGWFEIIASIVGGGLALIAIVVGVRMVDHHYQVSTCEGFGTATTRTVKFVDYSFWKYECLTPSKDGKWVTTDQLREM
jgi:hypothetical protein